MKETKLFNRNFTLMVLGQIASLFGNAILRFSLSLYVLDLTGSAAAFGLILALSMIPTILLSPVGGILADRMSRRNIMVALDFSTAALIALFTLALRFSGGVLLIGTAMLVLSVIQSIYQPAVQSSIPSLTPQKQLARANGVVVQVNALSGLLGPVIGGFLYAFTGIFPILTAAVCCFFLSAVMELFLHIPFTKPEGGGRFLSAARNDFKDALRFLTHEKPELFKLLFILAGLNLFLSSMIMVGLPYLIKLFLGLNSQFYGFAEGALAAGSILGGFLVGAVSKRLPFRRSYRLLLLAALMLLPMCAAVITAAYPNFSYALILLSIVSSMVGASLFNIIAQTFAQQQTPPELLGKVISLVTTISVCAFPLGQSLYGLLFDAAGPNVFLVVLLAVVASILITLAAKKSFRRADA